MLRGCIGWFAGFFASRDARRKATALAERLHPGEVRGASLVESEATRFVVRVYVGRRGVHEVAQRLPPWREWLIVAVPRNGGAPTIVDERERYRPVVR